MDKLLEIIEKNPRLSNSEIAVMLGKSEEETEEQIRLYEKSGIIKGYRAMIDKNKANAQTVTALIEIRVQPKFGHGFDEIANRIAALEEVESIYLMSGGFDLCCMVSDKSFEEIALFVANRLSPLDGVMSTATHFILKKYKVYHLLGADDEGRISYNLNRLQSDSLYARRAYIYDSIYYHKTDIRIERMECFPLELLNYQNKDTITLFSHEWAMNGHRNILNRIKLRQSIKWLAKNNYKFTFLE